MLMFKIVLLMAVAAPGVFALIRLDLKGVGINAETQVVLPADGETKINWGTFWDDNEGHNEFVTRNLQEGSEKDSQNCDAPNGLGLKNFFHQVEKLLPTEQITAIVKSYIEDDEIKAVELYMQNPQTLKKLKAIENSQEYQILKDFSCRILHIDLIRLTKILIGASLNRDANQLRKGIRGLIYEVDAVLPRQQLRDLYNNLLAADDELVKAEANLNSEKFHQLLLDVKNLPEYKDITNHLSALGVPIEEMRVRVVNALFV